MYFIFIQQASLILSTATDTPSAIIQIKRRNNIESDLFLFGHAIGLQLAFVNRIRHVVASQPLLHPLLVALGQVLEDDASDHINCLSVILRQLGEILINRRSWALHGITFR